MTTSPNINVSVNYHNYPNWEYVAANTERLRVPGGWLYKVALNTNLFDAHVAVSLCFVPDVDEITIEQKPLKIPMACPNCRGNVKGTDDPETVKCVVCGCETDPFEAMKAAGSA